MEATLFKGVSAVFTTTDNIAIIVLALMVALLLWLLISERRRSELAWRSHAELLSANNEVLSSLLITLELIKDRVRNG